jgi:Na+:H+ antiporter, NhaA family
MENVSAIDRLLRPVSRFVRRESTGGIVLFVSVVIALIWANSPWSHSYHELWKTRFSIALGSSAFDQPLHIWVNDGLMALFFFVIGLELKREFMAGELSTVKKAALPMVAALGGMLVPAGVYLAVNAGTSSAHGWGIPMATDIAFALAILSLAGKSVPPGIKVFLSALAVADDLGAVLVIAFFYTSHISFEPLFAAAGILIIIAAGNRLGVRHPAFYLVLGIMVWLGFLLSGVHATIAGVLVAFLIPARTKTDEQGFVRRARELTNEFESEIPLEGPLITGSQHESIQDIKRLCLDAETPLQKIEDRLHPWVAFTIMPLFALANSGMIIGADFFSAIANPVSLGVMGGLIAGKFAGVLTFTWLMVKLRLAELPEGALWRHVAGVSVLAGVGFTMSLFVTGLAFGDPVRTDQAKYGILIASLISGITGIIILKLAGKRKIRR